LSVLRYFLPLSVLWMAFALFCGAALASVERGVVAWDGIQDPRLRAAQFELLMGRPAAAISRVLADRARGRIAGPPAQARLVLAGMYLANDAHYQAAETFYLMADMGQPRAVRDLAWFQLARAQFRHGLPDEALRSLAQVEGELPPPQERERLLLSSLLLLQDERLDEAAQRLSRLQALSGDDGPASPWATYGRFNLGVALFRRGREQQGRAMLEAVGRLPGDSAEIQALRDKANLTLAFSYLAQQQPEVAQRYFNVTRLHGPLSNKALLGLGRAHAARGDYKKALVPWMQLVGRDASDPSVLDGLLAVPYAFGKLEALKQSLEYYQSALQAYREEMQRVRAVEAEVSSGALVEGLAARMAGEADDGGHRDLTDLSGVPGARHLWPLISTHEFREILENYVRVGRALDETARWNTQLAANASLAPGRRADLQARIAALKDRLTTTRQRLGDHMTRLASAELNRRKQRLVGYAGEARFSMAQIYDYAAKRWGGE